MTEISGEKRRKNLLQRMRKARGYLLPSWVYLAEKDPDFMEAYNNLYERALTDGKSLSAKVREFIAIGVLAYRGLEDAVFLHCKRALRLGATQQEILEAIESAMVPGGGPTLAVGLRALAKMEKEKKARKK